MNKLIYIIGFVLLLSVFSVSANLATDTVAYYKLDENTGTTADNAEGTASRDGTVTGATWTTGKINSGLSFDGSNDYVDVGDILNDITLSDTMDLSVSFWTKINDASKVDVLFSFGQTDNNGNYIALRQDLDNNGKFEVQTILGSGTGVSTVSDTSLSTTDFKHVVVTISGGSVSIYIDGVLDVSGGSMTSGSYAGLNSASIGALKRSTVIAHFDGFMDEVGIWDRALIATEVTELYDIQKDGFESGQYPFEGDRFIITAEDIYTDDTIEEFSVSIGNNNFSSVNNSIKFEKNLTGSETIDYTTFDFTSPYATFNFDKPNVNAFFNAEYQFFFDTNSMNLISSLSLPDQCLEVQNPTIRIKNPIVMECLIIDNSYLEFFYSDTSNLNLISESEVVYSRIVYNYETLPETMNITVSSTDYFPRTYTNYNISTNLQSELLRNQYTNNDTNINITDIYTNATINDSVLSIISTNYTHFQYNITAQDYFSILSQTELITSSFAKSMYKEGDIQIFIRNQETNELLDQNVTVIIENTESQQTYNFADGTGLISNLTLGNDYQVRLESTGYDNSFGTIQYTEFIQNRTFYMQQNGTVVSVRVLNTQQDFITNANVVIKSYVAGVLVEIQSKFSDVNGLTTFILKTDKTHLISVSHPDYEELNNLIIDFSDTDIVIILDDEGTKLQRTAYDGLSFSLSPVNFVLEPTLYNFSYTISSEKNTLLQFSLSIYNGTDLLDFGSSTDASGGTITIPYNVSGYENIRIVGSFVADGFAQQSNQRVFLISDIGRFDGSLLELRHRLQEELNLVQQFMYFTIFYFMIMIILSVFITGLPNVLITMTLSIIFAWVLGLNLFILIAFATILLIILIGLSIQR